MEESDHWKMSVWDDALSLYPRSHQIFYKPFCGWGLQVMELEDLVKKRSEL
jgi:hypothetical protein